MWCAVLSCLAVLQQKIVERAKQMTEDDSADKLNQKAALQQEFEQLLNIFFTGVRARHHSAACALLRWCLHITMVIDVCMHDGVSSCPAAAGWQYSLRDWGEAGATF